MRLLGPVHSLTGVYHLRDSAQSFAQHMTAAASSGCNSTLHERTDHALLLEKASMENEMFEKSAN